MRARTRRLLLLLVVILVVAAVLLALTHDIELTSAVGGREVVAVARGALSRASLRGGPSSVTLELGGRTATVGLESVTTGDGRTLAIPASCQQVEVRETSDGLDVRFDGQLAR
jgi:hypothetical protein